jgi:NitT/TauT family transport system substrate-binding protein
MRLVTAILIVAVLALSGPVHAQEAPAQTLRVGTTQIDLYAEAFYAEELGFFKKENLDVTVMTLSNAGHVAPAVLGGSIDIGVGDPVQVATAFTRGIPLTIVAGAGMYSTDSATTALCVAKDSPLRTVKDLAGKTIAVPTLGDTAQAGVATWLQQNGVDPSSVRFVEIPNPEMGAALAAGRIDAAMIPEPFRTIAQESNARLFAKPFDAIGQQFLIGVWYGKKDWVAQHADTVKRFVRAIYETARWANAHHAESAAILARHSKTSLATLQTITRAPYAEKLSAEWIQLPLDAAYHYHLLKEPVQASQLLAASPSISYMPPHRAAEQLILATTTASRLSR